jgi:hypothetical protein
MELLKAYVENRQNFLFIVFILFIFVILVSIGLFEYVDSIELTDAFHPLEVVLKDFLTERVQKVILIGESLSLIKIVYSDYIKFKKKISSL